MIKKITLDEFYANKKRRINGAVEHDINEFIKSEEPVCEVDIRGYKHIASAFAVYSNTIKRTGIENARVVRQNNRLFLLREPE